MNGIKIPRQFQQFGTTITVKWVDDLNDNNHASGQFHPQRSEILLQKSSKATPRTDDFTHSIFWHEIVHCCLYHIGRMELYDDEAFVDHLAGLLHQMHKTAVYPEPKPEGDFKESEY